MQWVSVFIMEYLSPNNVSRREKWAWCLCRKPWKDRFLSPQRDFLPVVPQGSLDSLNSDDPYDVDTLACSSIEHVMAPWASASFLLAESDYQMRELTGFLVESPGELLGKTVKTTGTYKELWLLSIKGSFWIRVQFEETDEHILMQFKIDHSFWNYKLLINITHCFERSCCFWGSTADGKLFLLHLWQYPQSSGNGKLRDRSTSINHCISMA